MSTTPQPAKMSLQMLCMAGTVAADWQMQTHHSFRNAEKHLALDPVESSIPGQ